MRQVSVRQLRNDTADVVAAVRAGERVTLTVNGDPVADIVPHLTRSRWVSGTWLQEQLKTRSADPQMMRDIREALPDTTDDL